MPSFLLGFMLFLPISVLGQLPINLDVKAALDSRLANVHLSEAHPSFYPFTVTYGSCHTPEVHHTISTVHTPASDRLLWAIPEDVFLDGCLSAWSVKRELVGRSQPLMVNKHSSQWLKKRERDRLSKRSAIPMTNASGIDVQGPWFDGVELLKDKEISAVNVEQAKSKSERSKWLCRLTLIQSV